MALNRREAASDVPLSRHVLEMLTVIVGRLRVTRWLPHVKITSDLFPSMVRENRKLLFWTHCRTFQLSWRQAVIRFGKNSIK